MKKIVGLLAVAVLMSVSAFSQKPTYYAKVNKVEGLYIYVNAEPVDQYEELGYLKKKVFGGSVNILRFLIIFLKGVKRNIPERTHLSCIYLPKEVKQQLSIFLM